MWRSGLCNMLLLTPFILSFALALPSQEQPAPRPNCIRMTLEKEEQIDLIVEKLGNFLNNLTIEHEHFDIRLIKLSIEQHTEDEIEEKETVLQLAVNDCKLSDDELEEIDHHREMAKQQEKEREANEADVLKQVQQKEANTKLTDVHEQKSEISQDKPEPQDNYENTEFLEQTEDEQVTQSNDDHPDVHEQKEAETLKNEQEGKENNENSIANDNVETSKNELENQDTDDKPEANNQTEDTLKNNAEGAKSGKHFEVMYLDLDDNGQKLVEAMGKRKKGPRIVYVQERNSGQTEYWFLKRR